MPKISAEAAARRRAHILAAARDCFAEHGIHVSVEEICTRAGISKGAFYGYFPSKNAAIEALAEDHEHLVAAFADIGTREELIERLLEYTNRGEVAPSRLELEAWAYSLTLPPLRESLRRNADSLTHAIAKSLTRIENRHATGDRAAPETLIRAELLAATATGLIASTALRDGGSGQDGRVLFEALISGTP